jgi:hypothetical protein
MESSGPGERVRPRAQSHAPRVAIGKNVAEGRWNFSISGAGHTRKASRVHRSFGTNPSFQLEGDAPSAPKLQVRSAVSDTTAAPPQKWDGSAIHPLFL